MPRALLYRSAAVHRFAHPGDLDILSSAWERNRRAGLTGFLLRTRTYLLQFIQGRYEAGRALRGRLGSDPRHTAFEGLA